MVAENAMELVGMSLIQPKPFTVKFSPIDKIERISTIINTEDSKNEHCNSALKNTKVIIGA